MTDATLGRYQHNDFALGESLAIKPIRRYNHVRGVFPPCELFIEILAC